MSLSGLFENVAHHIRLALRTVFRQRRAYFFPIGILALGIGMSVAMFSLADAVLLRPLPFPDQGSIQMIWKTDPRSNMPVVEMAYPELRDLQQNIGAFAYVALFQLHSTATAG